jgi:hypothetical protein
MGSGLPCCISNFDRLYNISIGNDEEAEPNATFFLSSTFLISIDKH